MTPQKENKYKNTYKPLFIVLLISLVCLIALVSLNLNESQKTIPKVKLSYFKNYSEFTSAIEQRLHLELGQAKHIWIGVEPEKMNHVSFALNLKNELEKSHGQFDKIILDKELGVTNDLALQFGAIQEVLIKENIGEFSDLIKEHVDQKVLVITASIYSTNLLKLNPIYKIKENFSYKPITFSTGHLALNLDDEKNNLFRCDTEDKTGVGDWGCAIINKARSAKRKIDLQKLKDNQNLILGLVDLTGESDYMVLLRANN